MIGFIFFLGWWFQLERAFPNFTCSKTTDTPCPHFLASPLGSVLLETKLEANCFEAARRRREEGHQGVDFHAERGTKIAACCDGTISKFEKLKGFGLYLQILCDEGGTCLYAHLQAAKPKARVKAQTGAGMKRHRSKPSTARPEVGERVIMEQPIPYFEVGRSGSSKHKLKNSAHLHFEFFNKDNVKINPLACIERNPLAAPQLTVETPPKNHPPNNPAAQKP